MVALSTVIPGISVGRSVLHVVSMESTGLLPASRVITATAAASVGATSVTLSSSTAGTIIRPGSAIPIQTATGRVVVFPTSATNVTLGTTGIAVACQPLLAAIPINSTSTSAVAPGIGPAWFEGLIPVRGMKTFDFGADPQETDLTGTDTPGGMVTGRTRTGITASGEVIERPGDAGAGAVIRAMQGSTDNISNLWVVFVRDDGATNVGLALFSTQGSPINFNGYAQHTFNVKFQGNTYTFFPPTVYS